MSPCGCAHHTNFSLLEHFEPLSIRQYTRVSFMLSMLFSAGSHDHSEAKATFSMHNVALRQLLYIPRASIMPDAMVAWNPAPLSTMAPSLPNIVLSKCNTSLKLIVTRRCRPTSCTQTPLTAVRSLGNMSASDRGTTARQLRGTSGVRPCQGLMGS